jgi:hypothetical protein
MQKHPTAASFLAAANTGGVRWVRERIPRKWYDGSVSINSSSESDLDDSSIEA